MIEAVQPVDGEIFTMPKKGVYAMLIGSISEVFTF